VTPLLSLAQSGSGQGDNRSVPKKEREIHGVDFRVVNGLFQFAQVRQTACSGTEAKLDRFFELETSDDNVVTGAKVKREVIDVGLPKPPSYIPKRRQY